MADAGYSDWPVVDFQFPYKHMLLVLVLAALAVLAILVYCRRFSVGILLHLLFDVLHYPVNREKISVMLQRRRSSVCV